MATETFEMTHVTHLVILLDSIDVRGHQDVDIFLGSRVLPEPSRRGLLLSRYLDECYTGKRSLEKAVEVHGPLGEGETTMG